MDDPKYGTFTDSKGKVHEIPPPGVEADDDDEYIKWVEDQENQEAQNGTDDAG